MNLELAIWCLFAINSFAQEWADYTVDDYMSVKIPNDFKVIDTLGQRIVKAQLDNAVVMIQRMPNSGKFATNILDKNELKRAYIGFQKGFNKGQKGKIISQEFIEKDGLLYSRFACSAVMGEEQQIRHCMLLFFKDHWYAVQFWELAAKEIELKNERQILFSSIKLPTGLGMSSQMSDTTEGSGAYKFGVLLGKLLGYAIILGLVISLIVWVLKR